MNSEETEQLAGRSRSRLPPSGRRYAKPPAAALLTGQVARELASTLKRLRLVRSCHLPWPWRSCCIAVHHGTAGEGQVHCSQTGWGLVLSFRARFYEAWAVTSPASNTQVLDFLAPATSIRSVTRLRPAFRSRRCNHQIGSEAITSYGLKYVIGAPGRTEQSIPLLGRREHRSCHFWPEDLCGHMLCRYFNFACSSDQYSMSKRSASLIGVKQP